MTLRHEKHLLDTWLPPGHSLQLQEFGDSHWRPEQSSGEEMQAVPASDPQSSGSAHSQDGTGVKDNECRSEPHAICTLSDAHVLLESFRFEGFVLECH